MYVIKKSSLRGSTLCALKDKLTAHPIVATDGPVASYPVYIESVLSIAVPKMFGISTFGPRTFNDVPWETEHKFNGTLRESQVEPVRLLLDSLHSTLGGILSIATGGGKTVCALYAMAAMSQRTLVVVNKQSLLDQWKSEISQYLPTASVGVIAGHKQEICDITLATIQTLIRRDRLDCFGLVVVDECHGVSSKVFSKALFKVSSKYSIGLSATPVRADGLEWIFKMHLGDIVYHSATPDRRPVVRKIPLHFDNYSVFTCERRGKTQLNYAKMISALVEMENRNKFIVDLLRDIASQPDRKILALSERRSHLEYLHTFLSPLAGLFLGGMDTSELNNAKTKQIILATYSSFSEGVSEKDLNTLVLLTPRKYVVNSATGRRDNGKLDQIVGRIFRKEHTVVPLIVDLQDQFSVFRSHANSRNVFYAKTFLKDTDDKQ